MERDQRPGHRIDAADGMGDARRHGDGLLRQPQPPIEFGKRDKLGVGLRSLGEECVGRFGDRDGQLPVPVLSGDICDLDRRDRKSTRLNSSHSS